MKSICSFFSVGSRSFGHIILLSGLLLWPLLSTAEDWQETKSVVANFSVELPGKSTYQADTIDTDAGKIKMHMFIVGADEGKTAYIVICNEYPDQVTEQKTAQKILDDAAGGAVGDGTLLEKKNIVYDGCPGRDIDFFKAGDSEKEFVRWRLLLFENNLYQIGYVSIGKKINEQTFDRMCSSFKLLRK